MRSPQCTVEPPVVKKDGSPIVQFPGCWASGNCPLNLTSLTCKTGQLDNLMG